MIQLTRKTEYLIFAGYFIGLFSFKLLTGYFSFSQPLAVIIQYEGLAFLGWIIGGVIGWNLFVLDYFVYVYFSHPQVEAALKTKPLVDKAGIKGIYSAIQTYKDSMSELGFRSAIFGAAWMVIALFAVTSTSSFLGKGVVMGLGLHLLLENWQLQKNNPVLLNKQLFWQVKRPVGPEEQKYYLYIFSAVFLILTVFI